VIFYHFGIPGFSGGFTGVDIFFVISGYLITNGIVRGVDTGKFTFGDFYVRRTRRLIPALLFTISATYIGSLFILSPKDLTSLSGSTVYALTGISNIYFWMQSGYFDNFSSLKPLLHTWSLSVELQFYLLWPFYLIVLCRMTQNSAVRAAGIIFLLFYLHFCRYGLLMLTQVGLFI
jgi:peptidoglycan/LPS O-acetylase OafA/YrhL